MSVHTGRDGAIFSGVNAIASIVDFKLNTVVDQVESTVMGANYKTYITTFKEWSGSMTFYFDPDDTLGQQGLGAGDTPSLEFYTEGNTSGKTKFAGSANLLGDAIDVTKDGMVSRTIEFTGTGDLVESVVS